MNFSGTIRIKKESTLQRWIDKGWYKSQLDRGYIFYPACGRFRLDECKCCKCRKPNSGNHLRKVLQLNNL